MAGQAVVLARLGQRDEAHARIAEALALDERPEVRYQAGCVYALTSEQVRSDGDVALVHLKQAIEARYGLDLLEIDKDLAAVRNRRSFTALVEAAKVLRPKH